MPPPFVSPGRSFVIRIAPWGGAQSATSTLCRVIHSSVVVGIPFRDTSVYGNGVRRPLSVETDGESASIVEFGASGSRLYGTGKANTLLRMSVGPDGLTVVDQHALTGGGHSQFVQGRLYTTGGYVIDPEVPSALGRLGSAGNYPWTVAEDVANGFVYGALDRTTAVVVSEYDAVTLLPTQSVELPPSAGPTDACASWGQHRWPSDRSRPCRSSIA